MEIFACKLGFIAFLLSCFHLFSGALSGENVRGVNLGGWLVVEGWMKPDLFEGITNGDMLDGKQVQFRSVALNKYVAAENAGGSSVSVNRDSASAWESFKLWRVSETDFQFRSNGGQFLSCDGEGAILSAMATSPGAKETFTIERNENRRVHIRLVDGPYLQATSSNQLIANYPGVPGWDDNMATFEMAILDGGLQGEYQLANGLGPDKASQVLEAHRSSYITEDDFIFLSQNGINTVRIPVGWWIQFDPNPPAPYVGGSLNALDNAFTWAESHGLKCIIDVHAAPGSQNGMEHSSSRDGSADWATSQDNIAKTLEFITFLANRYANRKALLGIELLNEPTTSAVPNLDVLVSYYKRGYEIVQELAPNAYVIICQRIGANQMELFNANIGFSHLVVDFHWYNLFNDRFNGMSTSDNIAVIYNERRDQVRSANSVNGPLVFIGEWVNNMQLGSASQSDFQAFGKAQLEVYGEASFGWAYWSFKNNQDHWSLEWNIKNNYIQL